MLFEEWIDLLQLMVLLMDSESKHVIKVQAIKQQQTTEIQINAHILQSGDINEPQTVHNIS